MKTDATFAALVLVELEPGGRMRESYAAEPRMLSRTCLRSNDAVTTKYRESFHNIRRRPLIRPSPCWKPLQVVSHCQDLLLVSPVRLALPRQPGQQAEVQQHGDFVETVDTVYTVDTVDSVDTRYLV